MNKNIRLSKLGWLITILRNFVVIGLALFITHLLIKMNPVNLNGSFQISLFVVVVSLTLLTIISVHKVLSIVLKLSNTLKEIQQAFLFIVSALIFNNSFYLINKTNLQSIQSDFSSGLTFVNVILLVLFGCLIINHLGTFLDWLGNKTNNKLGQFVDKVIKFFEETDHLMTEDLTDKDNTANENK